MREVKGRYPRNRVQAAFTGSDSFLRHPAVLEAKNYAGVAEIILSAPERAQELLAEGIANGVQFQRFEVIEPTLEDIFIETVKATPEYAEDGGKINA